jgi:polypeptide N-acetylgalactosaminyltransferase
MQKRYSPLLTVSYIIVQVFAYTKRQQIMSDDNCLDASSPEGPVKLVRCHGMGGNQAWTYNTQVFVLQLYFSVFKLRYDEQLDPVQRTVMKIV